MIEFLTTPIGHVVIAGIVGFLLFGFLAWAFTGEYERDNRVSVHRRPRRLKPWHVEPIPPDTQAPARHRLETVREETTNLGGYANRIAAARAMLPMPLERTAIEGGNHSGTTRRIRQSQKEDGEEESGTYRQRRQNEGRALCYGEEGCAHEEAARQVGDASIFWRHDVITGEIVMVDERGDPIRWDDGSDERYPS